MRCFVCIDPDAEMRNALRLLSDEIRKRDAPPAKYVPPDQFHINLAFLGEIDGNGLAAVKEKLAAAAAGCAAPFWVEVAGVGAFPDRERPRVIFAGCAASELQKLAGEEPDFHPHMTIARIRDPLSAEGRLAGIFKDFGSLRLGKFLATEMLLKESVLSREGPIHSVIGRFPLRS